jgi:hypothetical protein
VLLILNKKKEGKWIGSAKGEPYAIAQFLGDRKDETAYFEKINMMCALYPQNYAEKPPKKKRFQKCEKQAQEIKNEEIKNDPNASEANEKEA